MKAKSALAGIALSLGLLSSAPASAAVSWGSHDAVEVGTTSSFLSSFDFSLSSLSSLYATVFTTSGGGIMGLFQGNTLLGGLIYTSITPSSISFANLAPGAYSYKMLNVGGPTTVVSAVSAVPEAETYAMLLAGLGMIGLVARRRFNG